MHKYGLNAYVDMPGHALTLSRTLMQLLFLCFPNNEGLPAVLIEAMAVGTPVVSTSCKSGPKEILSGGRLGMLVPVGSKNHMTKAILETLTHHMRIYRALNHLS